MSISLEKIDLIKERTGVSYKEAKDALEAAGGNVVEALVFLEEEQKTWINDSSQKEIMNKIKGILKKGNQTKIKVKSKEKTVIEIPASLGALGAVFLPKACALGTLMLLFTRFSLHLEKEPWEEEK